MWKIIIIILYTISVNANALTVDKDGSNFAGTGEKTGWGSALDIDNNEFIAPSWQLFPAYYYYLNNDVKAQIAEGDKLVRYEPKGMELIISVLKDITNPKSIIWKILLSVTLAGLTWSGFETYLKVSSGHIEVGPASMNYLFKIMIVTFLTFFVVGGIGRFTLALGDEMTGLSTNKKGKFEISPDRAVNVHTISMLKVINTGNRTSLIIERCIQIAAQTPDQAYADAWDETLPEEDFTENGELKEGKSKAKKYALRILNSYLHNTNKLFDELYNYVGNEDNTLKSYIPDDLYKYYNDDDTKFGTFNPRAIQEIRYEALKNIWAVIQNTTPTGDYFGEDDLLFTKIVRPNKVTNDPKNISIQQIFGSLQPLPPQGKELSDLSSTLEATAMMGANVQALSIWSLPIAFMIMTIFLSLPTTFQPQNMFSKMFLLLATVLLTNLLIVAIIYGILELGPVATEAGTVGVKTKALMGVTATAQAFQDLIIMAPITAAVLIAAGNGLTKATQSQLATVGQVDGVTGAANKVANATRAALGRKKMY